MARPEALRPQLLELLHQRRPGTALAAAALAFTRAASHAFREDARERAAAP